MFSDPEDFYPKGVWLRRTPHDEDWRNIIYAMYHEDADPRWLDILMPLLETTPEYAEKRLFFEAENAWISGDRARGGELLEAYLRGGGEPDALPRPYIHTREGQEFLDKAKSNLSGTREDLEFLDEAQSIRSGPPEDLEFLYDEKNILSYTLEERGFLNKEQDIRNYTLEEQE
jgi:hypothetical protein